MTSVSFFILWTLMQCKLYNKDETTVRMSYTYKYGIVKIFLVCGNEWS